MRLLSVFILAFILANWYLTSKFFFLLVNTDGSCSLKQCLVEVLTELVEKTSLGLYSIVLSDLLLPSRLTIDGLATPRKLTIDCFCN